MTGPLRMSVGAAAATLLAALCLGTLFQSPAWFAPTLVAVAAVCTACEVARQLRLPRLVVPLFGIGCLVATLTVLFARVDAYLFVLPTYEALGRFAELAGEAHEAIRTQAAPVAVTTPLTALTAAGVGAIALLVDTAAVTLRQPALAGLPLLGLYSVPATIAPDGVRAVPFVVAAAGYLALLLLDAEYRVTRWGRTVGGSGRSPRETPTPLGALGRRVGVAAVGLAVVLPVIVPAADDGVLPYTGFGAGGGRGANTVVVGNPILDLGRDLRQPADFEVMRYRTTDDDPDRLRVVVLDDFSGDVWQPRVLKVSRRQRVDRPIATARGLADRTPRRTVETHITIVNYESRWLPLLSPPRRVDGLEGLWLWDAATMNVFSTQSTTVGQSYTVHSVQAQPTAEQLRDAPAAGDDLQRFTTLESVPPSIADTARAVTVGASSDYAKALALQDWLRDPGRFAYNERAPGGTGLEAIASFLVRREGYCVHFASTMAVMARSLGVPARVAVGFLPGEGAGERSYSVSTHDAHAWPELYFEGAGWLAFEPTPAQRTGQPPAYARAPAQSDQNPGAAGPTPGSSLPTAAPAPANPAQSDRLAEAERRAAAGGSGGWRDDVPWVLFAALAGSVVVLAIPQGARRMVRRRRWASATGPAATAEAAWDELLDLVVDYRLALPHGLTPRQMAAALIASAGLVGDSAAALRRVALAAERARYAAEVGEVGDLRTDVATLRRALAAFASRRTRMRAVVVPASTGRLLHASGERIADALDGADRVSAAARAMVVDVIRGRPPRSGRTTS